MKAMVLFLSVVIAACSSQPVGTLGNSDAKELQFEEAILVHDQKLIIDGREWAVACQPMPTRPSQFKPIAYLTVEGGQRLDVVCVDDYLGGVWLMSPGSDERFYLAQSDGDAGEQWESRSQITKSNNTLRIEKVSVTSSPSDDAKAADAPACRSEENAYTWEKGSFKEVGPAKEFTIKDFNPPLQVSEVCLGSNGRWKGDAK